MRVWICHWVSIPSWVTNVIQGPLPFFRSLFHWLKMEFQSNANAVDQKAPRTNPSPSLFSHQTNQFKIMKREMTKHQVAQTTANLWMSCPVSHVKKLRCTRLYWWTSIKRWYHSRVWSLCKMFAVVQFYPWFNFYFLLFQTHYHKLSYPKSKENKKLNQG